MLIIGSDCPEDFVERFFYFRSAVCYDKILPIFHLPLCLHLECNSDLTLRLLLSSSCRIWNFSAMQLWFFHPYLFLFKSKILWKFEPQILHWNDFFLHKHMLLNYFEHLFHKNYIEIISCLHEFQMLHQTLQNIAGFSHKCSYENSLPN